MWNSLEDRVKGMQRGRGGQLCYIVFLESDFRGVISKARTRLAFHSALYFFVETLEFIYFEQSPGESEARRPNRKASLAPREGHERGCVFSLLNFKVF